MPCPVGVCQIWDRNSDLTDCAFNIVPFIKTALPYLVAWEPPIPCNGTKIMNTQMFSVFPLPAAAKEGGVFSLLPPLPGGLFNFYYTWREQGKENICGWGGKEARERGRNSGKGRRRFVLKNVGLERRASEDWKGGLHCTGETKERIWVLLKIIFGGWTLSCGVIPALRPYSGVTVS